MNARAIPIATGAGEPNTGPFATPSYSASARRPASVIVSRVTLISSPENAFFEEILRVGSRAVWAGRESSEELPTHPGACVRGLNRGQIHNLPFRARQRAGLTYASASNTGGHVRFDQQRT